MRNALLTPAFVAVCLFMLSGLRSRITAEAPTTLPIRSP